MTQGWLCWLWVEVIAVRTEDQGEGVLDLTPGRSYRGENIMFNNTSIKNVLYRDWIRHFTLEMSFENQKVELESEKEHVLKQVNGIVTNFIDDYQRNHDGE